MVFVKLNGCWGSKLPIMVVVVTLDGVTEPLTPIMVKFLLMTPNILERLSVALVIGVVVYDIFEYGEM
jgi:hypothetical protein